MSGAVFSRISILVTGSDASVTAFLCPDSVVNSPMTDDFTSVLVIAYWVPGEKLIPLVFGPLVSSTLVVLYIESVNSGDSVKSTFVLPSLTGP